MLVGLPGVAEQVTEIVAVTRELHAPEILDLEVVSAIRSVVLRRLTTIDHATRLIASLATIPIIRHSHQSLLTRVWQLRDNATAYDAAYLALAEQLDAPLVTRDARLARAAGHRARVRLVE